MKLPQLSNIPKWIQMVKDSKLREEYKKYVVKPKISGVKEIIPSVLEEQYKPKAIAKSLYRTSLGLPIQAFKQFVYEPEKKRIFPSSPYWDVAEISKLPIDSPERRKKEIDLYSSLAFMMSATPRQIKGIDPEMARKILKVKPDAPKADIDAAYRKTIAKEYPRTLKDLASRYKTNISRMIGEARDVLLKEAEMVVPPTLPLGPGKISKAEEVKLAQKKIGEARALKVKKQVGLAKEDILKGIPSLKIGPEATQISIGAKTPTPLDEAIKKKEIITPERAKEIVKKPSVEKAIPKELEPLAKEARKYKSAEDFKNGLRQEGKLLYHGSPVAKTFDTFDEWKKFAGTRTSHVAEDVGIHFTDSKEYAEIYSKEYEVTDLDLKDMKRVLGKIPERYKKLKQTAGKKEVYLDFKNPLVVNNQKIDKQLISKAKSQGNDAIINKNIYKEDSGKMATEYVVFDTDIIKTSSQLTDFYNQATVEKAPTKAQIEAEEERILAEARGEVAEAKKAEPYAKEISKFKNFLRIAGEKKLKETGELAREHIPTSVFGISSDEVASTLGKTENEFMAELTEDIERAQRGNKIAIRRVRTKIAKIKSVSDALKLDKDFYKAIEDLESDLKTIPSYKRLKPYKPAKEIKVKPTKKTKAKIAKEKKAEIAKEKRYVTRKEIVELHALAKSVGQRLGPGRTSQQLANEVAKLIGKSTMEGIDVAMGKPYKRSVVNTIRGTFIDSIRDYIGRQGSEGKKLSAMLLQTRRKGDQLAGEALANIEPSLNKLTDEEAMRFVSIREGDIEPDTPALKEALDVWNTESDKIFKTARTLGLDIGYQKNYFPHFVPQEIIKNAKARKEGLAKAVRMGWADNITEAESKFNQYLLRKTYRRYGHLEKPRETDFPIYERDPRKVLRNYIDSAWHRIADAQHLGTRDEKAYKLADQIAVQGGDANTVRHMLDMTFGKIIHPQTWKDIEKVSGAIQVLTKFTPLTSLSNATQKLEVLAWVGPKVWTKHILKKIGPKEREWAMRTGAILDSSKKQFLQEVGGGSELVSRYLRKIRFSAEEDLNKIFTANAGKEFIKETFDKYLADPRNEAAKRTLERFGVDVLMATTNGKLSNQDLVNASQFLNDVTQYPYKTEELPMFFNEHPLSRILTRWKSFMYFSTKNKIRLAQEAFKEIKHGNFSMVIGILLAFGIGYQVVGEIMNDLWAFVSRRSRDEKGFARLFDNYLWMGTVVTDALKATRYGRAGIYSFLTGPDIATAVNLIDGIASLTKDRKTKEGMEEVEARIKPLGKTLLREIPAIGPAIPSLVFPPEKKKEQSILEKYGIMKPTGKQAGEDILKKYGIK